MKLEHIQKLHPEGTERASVLMVHGACMGAWVWEDNFFLYFFEKGFNVHAISLRNHCGSAYNGKLRWTGIIDYVEDIREIIELIDKPLFIIGHSMGGFIMQHLFKKNPSNIKGIILLCSAPNNGLWGLIGRLSFQYPLMFLFSIFKMSWLPIIKNKDRLKTVMFSPSFPDDKINKIVARLQDESFLAFLEMVFLRLPSRKDPPVPLMVIGAENDYLVSEKETRKMAISYGVAPVIIKGASHCLMLETGWEYTADLINEFFLLH